MILSKIVKHGIKNGKIKYEDLYTLSEEEVLNKLKENSDDLLKDLFIKFERITKDRIPTLNLDNLKRRDINPLVNGERLSNRRSKHL